MKNWAVSCLRCWRKVCLPDCWYWFEVCLWLKKNKDFFKVKFRRLSVVKIYLFLSFRWSSTLKNNLKQNTVFLFVGFSSCDTDIIIIWFKSNSSMTWNKMQIFTQYYKTPKSHKPLTRWLVPTQLGISPAGKIISRWPNIGQLISLSIILLLGYKKYSHSCLFLHCISTKPDSGTSSHIGVILSCLCCTILHGGRHLKQIVQSEWSLQKLKNPWKWHKRPFSSSTSIFWASICSGRWQNSTISGPGGCLDWLEPWSPYGGCKSSLLWSLSSVTGGTLDAWHDMAGNTELWWPGWRRWSAVPRGRWSCWSGRCGEPRWGNTPG